MVSLETVTIPGYAEAVRKEQQQRLRAFLDAPEMLCGVAVKPVSLRLLVTLEIAMNGFVVPCEFESDEEAIGHALQVVYFAHRPFSWKSESGFFRSVISATKRENFIRRLHWRHRKRLMDIAEAVRDWMSDAFEDAPKAMGSSVKSPSYAAYPAYLVDFLAEAGVKVSPDEIMDMPVNRLWQYWRVGVKRLNPKYGLTNTSTRLAVDFVSGKSTQAKGDPQ